LFSSTDGYLATVPRFSLDKVKCGRVPHLQEGEEHERSHCQAGVGVVGWVLAIRLLWAGMPGAEAQTAQQDSQRWNADDAVSVASFKFWERYSSCNFSNCYDIDSVLFAVNCVDVPTRLKSGIAELIRDGTWTATPTVKDGEWQVMVQLAGSESQVFFHVVERTGIVVAHACS
jgi:hypothetical protein